MIRDAEDLRSEADEHHKKSPDRMPVWLANVARGGGKPPEKAGIREPGSVTERRTSCFDVLQVEETSGRVSPLQAPAGQ